MRILIVDDDQLALDTLACFLRQDGHEPIMARNGNEALAILSNEDLQLVISDWVMPQMDGLELCRRIRQADRSRYVYTILLTAQGGMDSLVAGLSAGADDFLVKPFHPKELHARVGTATRILAIESREVAIFAMAKLVESRDPETGEHLERMRRYSAILAKRIEQDADLVQSLVRDFSQLIYLTSPLHDVGKVGIPDFVLLKPGRLSDREFEIMKTHTTIGAQTLDAAVSRYPGVEYLRMARDIALTHHERFDGSGYPSGLSGENIPICGRVVALADVYDALSSKRVYKAAIDHDVARSIILNETGAQFDPRVVDAFIESEEEFQEVRDRFQSDATHDQSGDRRLAATAFAT